MEIFFSIRHSKDNMSSLIELKKLLETVTSMFKILI